MLDYGELAKNPYYLRRNVSIANAPGPNDKTYGNIFEYGADQLDTWTTDLTPHPDSPAGKRQEEGRIIAENKRIEDDLNLEAQKIYNKDINVGTIEERLDVNPETGKISLLPLDDTKINTISNMDDIDGDLFYMNPADTLKTK